MFSRFEGRFGEIDGVLVSNTYLEQGLGKFVLDNREKGWYSRRENKAGRVHPPHLQPGEEVDTADSVPKRGAYVFVRVREGIRAFVLCCVLCGQMLKEVLRLLAL